MGSVIKDKTGLRRLSYFNVDGKRKTLYLGRITQKDAQRINTFVENLVNAQITKQPIDSETARWVAGLGDKLAGKLAGHGLIEPRAASTLLDFIDAYVAGRTDVKPNTVKKYKAATDYLVEFFGADKPLKVQMLGQRFALWRDAKGAVRCVSDTCTHRSGSLGDGRVRNGCIECPYHGWTFQGDGTCVRIPSLGAGARIPERTRVDAYPVVENEHRRGILHRSIAPARVGTNVRERAVEAARDIAEGLGLVGVLAVEMFALPGGEIVVNELAPRPHNSGHFTLDACATSQFEQAIRAVAGLGLGSTEQLVPAVMLNILGEHLPAVLEKYTSLMQDPHVKVHLYGKAQARPGRKMGHILVMDRDLSRCVERADALWSWLTGERRD